MRCCAILRRKWQLLPCQRRQIEGPPTHPRSFFGKGSFPGERVSATVCNSWKNGVEKSHWSLLITNSFSLYLLCRPVPTQSCWRYTAELKAGAFPVVWTTPPCVESLDCKLLVHFRTEDPNLPIQEGSSDGIGLVGVNRFLLYDEEDLGSPDLTIAVVSSRAWTKSTGRGSKPWKMVSTATASDTCSSRMRLGK